MGYYVRVLTPSQIVPDFATLCAAISTCPGVSLSMDNAGEFDWEHLLLEHDDGTAIAAIERNPVEPGRLGAAEIAEFLEGIENYKPASAVERLKEYLPTVNCIYAFQILSGARSNGGWPAIDTLREAIRDFAGGIIQADGEGFSNEEGSHILWQFSSSAKGPYRMALRQYGGWITFNMELSDPKQREAFLRDEVPQDAQIL